MGFRPKRDTKVLKFADGELAGLEVEVRDISTADMLDLMLVVEQGTHSTTIRTTARALAGVVTGWNIVDDDGQAVPVSEAALLDLPLSMLTELCQSWFRAVAGTVTDGSPLGVSSPSTGPSAGEEPELPMEPL